MAGTALVARLEGEAALSALATRAASIMGETVYRDSSSLRALSSLPVRAVTK
jgi:hypothetical protein